jgi:hypothetical protein
MTTDSDLRDRTLICSDCGKDFVFTVGEQAYFLKKELSVPKRCRNCRALRKLDYSPIAHKEDS